MNKAPEIDFKLNKKNFVDYLAKHPHINNPHQLALAARMTPSTVTRLLNHDRHLTLDDVKRLAETLSITPLEFLQIIGFVKT